MHKIIEYGLIICKNTCNMHKIRDFPVNIHINVYSPRSGLLSMGLRKPCKTHGFLHKPGTCKCQFSSVVHTNYDFMHITRVFTYYQAILYDFMHIYTCF